MATRRFLKHKVFGTLYAVEFDSAGMVQAATAITDAIACKHRIGLYHLGIDLVDELIQNHGDYEAFDPVCSDAVHLLADIGQAERDCVEADSEYQAAAATAKAAKEHLQAREQALRQLVRSATQPAPLPLFDAPPAA